MKRLLLLFAACLLTLTTWAIPARRYTFTVTQPDGSVITLQLVGDEYFHYYRNVATGEALTLASDGSYVPLSAGDMQSRQQEAQQHRVAANVQRAQRLARRREATGPNRVGSIKPMSGTKKGLVVLVNFTDKKCTNTVDVFNKMFNQEGYNVNEHIGSVRDYFKDQSYGALTIDFDVVGPVELTRNVAYYGGNNSYGKDSHPGDMAKEACRLADGLVNYKDYDWDGDGEVDQVFIIYAGCGEASGGSSDTIWPHEWTLQSATGSYLTLDGVRVDTYACTSELVGSETENMLAPIGTACHEFSHCLGFPDMYDTNYNGSYGMGSWDVMDLGSYNGPSGYGETPCGYTAYERWQAGWLTPKELSSPKTVSGMKGLGTSAEAYILYNPANRNEYLLFENRQPQRWFEYLEYFWPQAGGLLVTHVDYDATAWVYNTVNNDPSHQRCSIIPASKKYGTLKSSDGQYFWENLPDGYQKMLFPAGASSLTETSHASCGGKWFNGSTSLGHSFTEITNADGLVGFKFDGGGVEDDGSRYTVAFDPGTGSCGMTSWTQSSFGESVQVPDAYVASSATGYSFIGWSETPATGSKPAIIYGQNSYYTPTKNVTLYAVYKSTTAGGTSGEGGSYTLDYSKETNLQNKTFAYTKAQSYTATDGGVWEIKAYKVSGTAGIQINKGKGAYIKVPTCSNPITTIEVTDATAQVLKFASVADATSPAATSASSTNAVLDATGKNLTTGYIYTTAGSTVITKIVVNYGANGMGTDYQTRPGTADLQTPSLSFASKTQSIEIGDYRKFEATVTYNPGNAQVTYFSSDETVATVGPTTGGVKAQGAGTCTITATIPAVAGVSREAKASYTLTVTEPATTSIYIATPPTKTTYNVGDTFDPTGMVVNRKFANGNSATIASGYYSWTPAGALSATDTKVTVKYNEDGTWFTVDVPITVKAPTLYTVTFDACGGSCLTSSLTELISGAGVTLPAATTSVAGWTFAGWATERISENMSTSPKVYAAGSNFKLTANTTLYAVYVYTETTSGTGSGNYECVEQEPSDWAGDYVIVPLEDTNDGNYNLYVANGAQGGTSGIGAASAYIYPRSAGYDNNSDTFNASKADPYHVTIEKVNGQYYFKTGDGKYNYRSSTATSAGINTAEKISEATPVSFVFNDWDDIRIRTAGGSFTFGFNLDSGKTYFRFYKNSTVSDYVKAGRSISLYKKQGSVLSSTYCSYPAGNAPTTVSALTKVISGLSSGTTTLSDLQNIIDRILQR